MGLDQNAYKVKKKYAISSIAVKDNCLEDSNEIMYWRKSYDVQDFMENLYRKKGGKNEFNCEVVRVTNRDLDNFEKYVIEDETCQMSGACKYDIEQNKKFIQLARDAILEGYYVYYWSWW